MVWGKAVVRGSPLKNDLVLAGILALAFCLRLAGIQFGLPHLYHADEPIVVNHALAYGMGDFNPHFFKIPPLVSYLLFGVFGLYFVGGRMLGLFRTVVDFEHLFYADPSSFYLMGRFIFGVLMGTATVYLLYRLILKFFGRERALLSAFFLAVSFLHVRDSHYIYTDIPLVLVMVAAFFFLLSLVSSEKRLSLHLASGAMIGLATATKYNGIALVVPYLYIIVVSSLRGVPPERAGRRSNLSTGIASPRVAGLAMTVLSVTLAGFAVFLAYFLLNPYSLLDFGFFCKEITAQAKSQEGVGWMHHLRYSLIGGMGFPLFFFALAGMIRALVRWDSLRGIFAVFLLSYYVILAFAAQPYDRYVLPLLPFLVFFAADLVLILAERFGKYRKPVLGLVVGGLVFPSLLQSVLFDRVMTAKDTRTLAKEWIEENIAGGSHLALGWDFYMPRLAFSKNQLLEKKEEVLRGGLHSRERLRKLDYLLAHSSGAKPSYNLFFLLNEPEKHPRFLLARPVLPYDLGLLKDRGIDYVIVARMRQNQEPRIFYDELGRQAELVIEFNPYRNVARKWPIDRQPLTGGPFLFEDLWLRERNGQIIEVYKLH